MDFERILKFLWDSFLSPHKVKQLSVSLPWAVPQPYRPRQELHLHLDGALQDDSFRTAFRLEITQNIAHLYIWESADSISSLLDGRWNTSTCVFFPPFQDSIIICKKSASICTEQCGGHTTLWAINAILCLC